MSVVMNLLIVRHSGAGTFGEKISAAMYEGACLAKAFGLTGTQFEVSATRGLPAPRAKMLLPVARHAWLKVTEIEPDAA
jgi:hypothetical protein